ncbi:MAG: hypothetical protein AB8G11_12440 [Saprospiraceae bacterium]
MNNINSHESLDFSVEMSNPNKNILIHKGKFSLRNDVKSIIVDGEISFKWFPSTGVYFEGLTTKEAYVINNFGELGYFQLYIEELFFGRCFISTYNLNKSNDNQLLISGVFTDKPIFGDNSMDVQHVQFSIPNMKLFFGEFLKTERELSSNKFTFTFDNYIIVIDKTKQATKNLKKLKKTGGYFNIYAGLLRKKEGTISLEETQDILYSFNTFISILNGRRISTLFLKGLLNDNQIWTDFTTYSVAPYKDVENWTYSHPEVNYTILFNNFYDLWKNEDDRNFLESLTSWYLEVNNGFHNIESSIAKGQITLELLYNWLLIEKNGFEQQRFAVEKIRDLLTYLKVDFSVPSNFENLQKFIDDNRDIIDAPDSLVRVRNAIVHSQLSKRRRISEIGTPIKLEILHLTLWYIELAIMSILEYDGMYINRCNPVGWVDDMKEFVPWNRNVR